MFFKKDMTARKKDYYTSNFKKKCLTFILSQLYRILELAFMYASILGQYVWLKSRASSHLEIESGHRGVMPHRKV